ncbi:MAG: hypothetical protein COA38_21135 [Fluviicola sp.]|nr:MAG: hypothetical protein COA38_21135 [Fluviicola sp.]
MRRELSTFKKQKNRLELGVIESMISSIRDNRRVRGEQKTMRDRSDGYSYQKSTPLEFVDSMSAEEHEKHQSEWTLRKRSSHIRLGILLGGIVMIISVFLVWLAL